MVRERIRGTAVAKNGRALLIQGPSGAGKSALAIEMIALGAQLVSDDYVEIEARGDALYAMPVANTSGMIEARGIGLLNLPVCDEARLFFCVDLGVVETERLPQDNICMLLERKIALLHKCPDVNMASALLLLLTNP